MALLHARSPTEVLQIFKIVRAEERSALLPPEDDAGPQMPSARTDQHVPIQMEQQSIRVTAHVAEIRVPWPMDGYVIKL